MGNGQRRNRRGARPRPAPHKHGGAGNPGRASQLIPPTIAVSEASGDLAADSAGSEIEDVEDVADVADMAHPTTPPEVAAAPAHLALTDPAAASQNGAPAGQAAQVRRQRASDDNGDHSSDHTNQYASHAEAHPREASAPQRGRLETGHNGAAPGRGRFERFYAPGQGPRVERVERVAPSIIPTPPVSAPPPAPRRIERTERPVERVERAPAYTSALDEDDGPEIIGPRGDVRGSVGTLVDSLHEVFVRDRAMASQGGVSRCGVCYLHFPVGELTYREGEGFYVCASCAHALGSARVPMVRRQQRQ